MFSLGLLVARIMSWTLVVDWTGDNYSYLICLIIFEFSEVWYCLTNNTDMIFHQYSTSW
jgi:hypothetical protein